MKNFNDYKNSIICISINGIKEHCLGLDLGTNLEAYDI